MPLEAMIGVNPAFKPADKDEEKALSVATKKGNFKTDYANAMEAIRNSKGMYALVQDVPAAVVAAPRSLDDMTNDELKLAALSAGVTLAKGMKRADLIVAITAKLAEVDISDDA